MRSIIVQWKFQEEKQQKQNNMKNQKSVFEFGDEFICTEFFDVETNSSGVDINRNGVEHLGSIIGVVIPDIDDEDENVKFDLEVINWVVDNGF